MPPRKKSNKGKGKGSKKKASPVKAAKPEKKTEDVKMADAEVKTPEDVKETKDTVIEDKIDPKAAIRNDINFTALLILQAVESKDLLVFIRVTRQIQALRKKTTVGLLSWAVTKYCPELLDYLAPYAKEITAEQAEDKKTLEEIADVEAAKKRVVALKLAAEKAAEDTNSEQEKTKAAKAAKEKQAAEAKEAEKKKTKEAEEAKKEVEAAQLVEVKKMLHLMVLMFLSDRGAQEESLACAQVLVDSIQDLNKRSLDQFSGKAFFYYTLSNERLGHIGSTRNRLLQYHRTAALQHNEPGQAVLVVAILRSFLHFKLYQQADKFRLNTTLPESTNNDMYARYVYYIGQINAVQLQYSDAYNHLTQAVRKAPQTGAVGFRQSANKLLVIVQLLMGEIPDRAIFITGDLAKAMKPYFKLTQAVRVGDLTAFESTASEFAKTWEKDGLSSLVARLRNNVIKTGLRKINTAYSRVSLADVSTKLNLESVEDAEHIVSKCIHDGVVDAAIDHSDSFMFSKDRVDKYATYGPQAALHKRIMFCMEIHNEAVKGLRYPPNVKDTPEEPELEMDEVELEADAMDDD